MSNINSDRWIYMHPFRGYDRMVQAKFKNGKEISDIPTWVLQHNSDYAAVHSRLEAIRNVVLKGRIGAAADILRKSYHFAVLSIQTERERHERAFTAYYAGSETLKDACLQVVYGGQKYNWIDQTHDQVDFETLARVVRIHAHAGRHATLLDVIDDQLTGVAYRKGAFMLAMSGMYEYMCIDSNVGRYADIEKREEFDTATEYMDMCSQVREQTNLPKELPPFLVQWAIYDFERGEHARHMPYFREVFNQ